MGSSESIIVLVLVFILLILSAFFSAAETAYSSVNKATIELESRKDSRTRKLIKKQYNSFGWTFATILLSNNIVNIAASSLVTYLFALLFTSSAQTTLYATFAVTPFVVIFGEIIPKIVAKKWSYKYLTLVAWTLEILNYLFFIITYPLSKLNFSSKVTNTESELQDLINIASSEGVLEHREATLANNALRLDSTKVKEIMTPVKKVSFIKMESTIKEAMMAFKQTGHSRLAVKTGEKLTHILFLKDIIIASDDDSIQRYCKEPNYVSQHKLINIALELMRNKKMHIAFVLKKSDDLTKVMGIVTMEDILEELIGEIYDEHDPTLSVREIGLHKFLATGKSLMSLLASQTGQNFGDTQGKTIKQWLSKKIYRSLKTGLKYTYKNKVQFHVVSLHKDGSVEIEITIK